MKPFIIQKLKLRVSPRTIGASFLHDITVYDYFPGVWCAMCDPEGKPDKLINFYTVYGHCKVDLNFVRYLDDAVLLAQILSKLNTKQDETNS